MAAVSGLPIIIASLNLAGSLLSFVGSGFIILCYLILPRKRHFRHVLILNLATADCINALSDSISGLFLISRRRALSAGPACIANGFMGQITVQATDCAILAIAAVTVYTITKSRTLDPLNGNWGVKSILLITATIWILPFITSFLALGMNWYGPASGSWCWLVESPTYIRYVLTHGWRFLFIAIEIGLYTYLHFFLKKHYRQLAKVMSSNYKPPSSTHELVDISAAGKRMEHNGVELKLAESSSMTANSDVAGRLHDTKMSSTFSQTQDSILIQDQNKKKKKWSHILSHRRRNESDAGVEKHHPRHKSIQRILLLNAYPLAYIILWIPRIANRLIEASGHTSTAMQILQASTQFVGLANALTYGWNEGIAEQLKRKYFWN